MDTSHFQMQGYTILPNIIDAPSCQTLAELLSSLDGPGTRSLLDLGWCRDVAQKLKQMSAVAQFLEPDSVAVQCTAFDKTPERNWLVAFHQDLSIPVAEEIDAPGILGWSRKEGITYVQPPDDVLKRLVAIRLHLDPCDAENGPLRVIPGSQVPRPPE